MLSIVQSSQTFCIESLALLQPSQEELDSAPATPFFEEIDKVQEGGRHPQRCIACTIAAAKNISLRAHKGLCTEAMIYAGKKPEALRKLSHLKGMYKPHMHDMMSREAALQVLQLALMHSNARKSNIKGKC